MTTQDQINILSALQTSLQGQQDAVTSAISLLTNGYQSDQQAITDGITAGIATATDPLNARIATLTQLLQDNNIEIPN